MDFEETEEQKMIADTSREIAGEFGPDYWLEKEEEGEFGQECWDTLVKNNFTGILVPEDYEGEGMGMLEFSIAVDELASMGCAAGWYLGINAIFGVTPVKKFGTEEQKEKYLPKLAKGMEACMALTEPDSGSNTLNTKTLAVKEGDEYVINGQKMFTTHADRANLMLLITRTTPREKAERKTSGITLFLVDLPDKSVTCESIPKHAMNYSHTCSVFIDDLRVPEDAVVGEVDEGWWAATEVLNPERMWGASLGCGLGTCALNYAIDYAKKRNVFGDPIGSYQGIQLPIANAWTKIQAARLLTRKGAYLHDKGEFYLDVANAAKHVATDAATDACWTAVQTFGGYGFAKEQHVERWWREVQLMRLAPITGQLELALIGQHILGLPKSFRTV